MAPTSFRLVLLLTLLALSSAASATAQSDFRLDKEKIVLNPGQETVVVASEQSGLEVGKLRWNYNAEFVDITVAEQGGKLSSTIKAKNKAIKSLFVYATYGELEPRQVEERFFRQ